MENQAHRSSPNKKAEVKRRSAGILLVSDISGSEPLVLMLRSWAHWDFPKGGMETGETLIDTAKREVLEETGISQISFPWGTEFKKTNIYNRDKVAFYSLAKTATVDVTLDPNPSTGKVEHEEFRWIPWSDLGKYASPRLFAIISWASRKINQPVPEGVPADPPRGRRTANPWRRKSSEPSKAKALKT